MRWAALGLSLLLAWFSVAVPLGPGHATIAHLIVGGLFARWLIVCDPDRPARPWGRMVAGMVVFGLFALIASIAYAPR